MAVIMIPATTKIPYKAQSVVEHLKDPTTEGSVPEPLRSDTNSITKSMRKSIDCFLGYQLEFSFFRSS